jgi:hypothetical protein
LFDALRANGWILRGFAYKNTDDADHKICNEKMLTRWWKIESALFCPSTSNPKIFWLATRPIADWELREDTSLTPEQIHLAGQVALEMSKKIIAKMEQVKPV